jgi:hypothetical protein
MDGTDCKGNAQLDPALSVAEKGRQVAAAMRKTQDKRVLVSVDRLVAALVNEGCPHRPGFQQ